MPDGWDKKEKRCRGRLFEYKKQRTTLKVSKDNRHSVQRGLKNHLPIFIAMLRAALLTMAKI